MTLICVLAWVAFLFQNNIFIDNYYANNLPKINKHLSNGLLIYKTMWTNNLTPQVNKYNTCIKFILSACHVFFFFFIDNSLFFHICIIIRKHYHTYFELIHAFYSWFWNNAEKSILCLIEF